MPHLSKIWSSVVVMWTKSRYDAALPYVIMSYIYKIVPLPLSTLIASYLHKIIDPVQKDMVYMWSVLLTSNGFLVPTRKLKII